MTHHLKILPCYFREVASGNKTFELRKNDRDFKAGDSLILQEYNGQYTGHEITCNVPYVFHGGELGLDKDYCILSIANVKETEWHERIGYKKLGKNSWIKEAPNAK